MLMNPLRAAEASGRKIANPMGDERQVREGFPSYDVVKATSDFSNITGLVAGFALTAVVLAFTIAATAHLDASQRIELGFAATLFALGFVGCLVCAYSFASLSGETSSVATLTQSMLVGSGLTVCIVAVLGGFEALARAFLPDAAIVFLVVCGTIAMVAPPFVWFPTPTPCVDSARPPTQVPRLP